MGEEEDGEAVVLTELLTAVMSGNSKALGSLVDRVREGGVCKALQHSQGNFKGDCSMYIFSNIIAACIHYHILLRWS